jgi:hypothetical protein
VGGLDHEPSAIAELLAIYAFIDTAIANAGKPSEVAHDASAGVSQAAYEDASKALRDHVERNARWLKGDGAVSESLGRLRAQAQVALVDLLPDGLTRRVDAASRLALKGARRQTLVDWGILFQDAGKVDDAKAERVRQLLARLPLARTGLSVLYAGDDRGPLRARGLVTYAGGGGAGETQPFGTELTPFAVDGFTASITHDLALLTVNRALAARSDLRTQVDRDVAATLGNPARLLGRPRAPSVDHVLAAAASLLLLDAARTLDLAFARALAGHPESAALLSDAVGALAGSASTLELGRSTMTAVRLAPNGAALGFTLEGHAWAIERLAPSFQLMGVTRDGKPLALAQLATAGPRRE